jgi:hypothetical protein
MKSTLRMVVLSALALLVCMPAAFAQTPEVSPLTVTEPLDVGGTILQPGTYSIRVMPSFADRNKVQVTSPDLKTVYATVLTVPHYLEPNEQMPNTMFVFYPGMEGRPRALRTWFARFPDASQGGHDIVYEESRAKLLARANKSRVVSYSDTTDVASINDKTELHVITPEEQVETYTYTPPPAPQVAETRTETRTETPAPIETRTEETTTPTAMTSGATEMPQTAGETPLFALLGLAALGGAVVFRVARMNG